MREDTIKIKCETEGFDKAIEQVDALVEAYDGFPPQVQIKNCHDCTIKIYPSQTKFIEVKDESQTERRCGNCKFLTYKWNKVWCDIKCENPHDVVCDKWKRSSE